VQKRLRPNEEAGNERSRVCRLLGDQGRVGSSADRGGGEAARGGNWASGGDGGRGQNLEDGRNGRVVGESDCSRRRAGSQQQPAASGRLACLGGILGPLRASD
jgi:hypothetical protein